MEIVHKDIAILDLDHPGAKDPIYRERRNFVARLAELGRGAGEVPFLQYTEDEHRVWRIVNENLHPLHRRHASRAYLDAKESLGIPADYIPQLRDLSRKLHGFFGFKLEPIEGLVDSRSFLAKLAERTMWCTQYIRHASRPEYTPEPDVVHEVVGHVPTFVDADFVELSVLIGRAAATSTPEQLAEIERLYWYTIEFGLIMEANEVKAYGAGLLSSFGELENAFAGNVKWKPFVLEEVIRTRYDYSRMQPQLFIIPSFSFLREQVLRLAQSYVERNAIRDHSLHTKD